MKRLFAIALLVAASTAGAAPASTVEILSTGQQFAEGTIFVGPTLYYVDYGRSAVYRLEDKQPRQVWRQAGSGANGLVQDGEDLLVAGYDNGTIVRISQTGDTLAVYDHDDAERPFVLPNDLASDGRGGIYFTASGDEGDTLGKVYYLAPGELPHEVAGGIHNANGLVVSPNGKTLYVAESSTDRLFRFDIGAGGTLSHKQEFLALDTVLADGVNPRHTPDGVRIDRQGRLFVSLYHGGGFAVFAPDGKLLARVDLPGQHHANLALTPDEKFVEGTIANDSEVDGYLGALYRVPNPVSGG